MAEGEGKVSLSKAEGEGKVSPSKAEGEGKVSPSKDSASVQYLLSGPDTPYTCWFLVGHADDQPPELISGCRLHMMTYSVPLRNMLYDSEIAEEGSKENPVKIPDVKPDAFRNFVKFINFNKIPLLPLKEAIDLACVAEKYIVEDLKAKLGKLIGTLLNVDNVFVPLNQPECFQNDALRSAMYKIIQSKTKELFAKEQFLELSSTELIHIVIQDTLAVDELELWREILRWAKHKAESEEGKDLRECMLELLKHIRFCTLNVKEFCTEVVTTGILTPDEIASINMVFGGKLDSEKCSSICYELNPRALRRNKNKLDRGHQLDFSKLGLNLDSNSETSFIFITTDCRPIQLMHGYFHSPKHGLSCPPKNLKLQFGVKFTLTRITDFRTDTSTEQPVQFEAEKAVTFDTPFILHLPTTMKLLPYNKYKLEIEFSTLFPSLFKDENDAVLEHQGLTVSWKCGEVSNISHTHLRILEFKPVCSSPDQ